MAVSKFPPIKTVHGLIDDHERLPRQGAVGDAWYEEHAGLLWVWDQDKQTWRDLNLWHGKGFAASVANLVGLGGVATGTRGEAGTTRRRARSERDVSHRLLVLNANTVNLPEKGAGGDAWFDSAAGILWIWDDLDSNWVGLGPLHGISSRQIANPGEVSAFAGSAEEMSKDAEGGTRCKSAGELRDELRRDLLKNLRARVRELQPRTSIVDDDPIPDHATPFLIGEPVSLRLSAADVVQRAEAFATAGALVVEPIHVGVPDALAAQRPEVFAIRFPSGALAGVTARLVPGKPGLSTVEFANPIELIDPRIDEAPVGELNLMLFAFRREDPLGNVA